MGTQLILTERLGDHMKNLTFKDYPTMTIGNDFLEGVYGQLLLHWTFEICDCLALVFNYWGWIINQESKNSTEEWVAIQLAYLKNSLYISSVWKYWERSLLKGMSEIDFPARDFVKNHNVLDASLRYQAIFFGDSEAHEGQYPDWHCEVSDILLDNTPRTNTDIQDFMELHKEKLHEVWNRKGLPYAGAQAMEELNLLELIEDEENLQTSYRWATFEEWANRISISLFDNFGILPEDFQDWIENTSDKVLQDIRNNPFEISVEEVQRSMHPAPTDED